MKVQTKNDPDPVAQNRDFTLWKEDTYWDCVFTTDPYGRIVDAAVNYPGNFHDSKKALWSHMYEHILAIPPPYRVASDSAFVALGDFKTKVVKTKWKKNKDDCKQVAKSRAASQLTHLRQPAELSNNSISCFCFLLVFFCLSVPARTQAIIAHPTRANIGVSTYQNTVICKDNMWTICVVEKRRWPLNFSATRRRDGVKR